MLRKPGILLALQFVAFWPVWEWYALRLIHFPENRVSLVALVAVMVLSTTGRRAENEIPDLPRAPVAFMALYAAVYLFVHPLVSAALAFVSLTWTITGHIERKMRPGVLVLSLLALPIIPSLQSYVGYPLRFLVANGTAGWLQTIGFDVVAQGTTLRWNEQVVAVDEPCSGIRMLWTAMFIGAAFASSRRMGWAKTAGAVLVSIIIIVPANMLRAATLFFSETGIVNAPAWFHQAVGLVVFAATGAAILWLAGRLERVRWPLACQ